MRVISDGNGIEGQGTRAEHVLEYIPKDRQFNQDHGPEEGLMGGAGNTYRCRCLGGQSFFAFYGFF